MFGNRAKISAEELAYMKEQLDNDRGFFENVNAKSKLIEADFDELEKSRQLEESSLKQLNDNANNVVEFSKDSMDAISALNDSFTECVKAAADNLTSLESAAKELEKMPVAKKQSKEKICPECGLPMKKRNGRFGEFWGCTGYPDCRHTENT